MHIFSAYVCLRDYQVKMCLRKVLLYNMASLQLCCHSSNLDHSINIGPFQLCETSLTPKVAAVSHQLLYRCAIRPKH